MAKWTITFEDVAMPDGAAAVEVKLANEGDAVVELGWTPATQCALTMDYQWAHEIFQNYVGDNIELVAKYQMEMIAKQRALEESSALSDEG